MGPLPAWVSNPEEEASSAAAPVAEARRRVRGRVISTAGAPVPGARISVASIQVVWRGGAPVQGGEAAVTTDADGRFELETRAAWGQLQVSPPADGDLLPAQRSIPGSVGDLDLGDLSLVEGGRVCGFVLDERGAPLAGARVRLQQGTPDEDRVMGRVVYDLGSVRLGEDATKRGGIYFESASPIVIQDSTRDGRVLNTAITIVALEKGEGFVGGPQATTDERGYFELRRVPPGLHTLVAAAAGHRSRRQDGVSVRVATATRDLRLALAAAPALEVEAVDGRGVPIPGAVVAPLGYPTHFQARAADERGRAVVTGIDAPRAAVQVSAPGFVATQAWGVPGVPLRVTLRRGASVRGQVAAGGTVVLQPVPGTQVSERSFVPPAEPQVWGDGAFRCADLAPGQWDLLEARDGEVRHLTRVELREGDALDLGRLQGAALTPLEVRVLDAAGRPIPGVTVSVAGGQSATSDAEGRAALGSVLPGPLRLEVWRQGRPCEVRPLTVSPGGAPLALDLRLRAGGARLEVAVEGAADSVVLLDAAGAQVAESQVSDGRAEFEVAPGRYALRAGPRLGTAAPRETFELQAGAQRRRFVAPPRATLRCRVLGPDGAPLAGLQVLAGALDESAAPKRVTAPFARAQSDAEGRLELPGLPQGPCSITVFHGDRALTFQVEVEGDAARTLRLTEAGVQLADAPAPTRLRC
ncbi:MAG: carboxypeptidase regulatory-like domain-containing protein [Planctomycetota bacterium]